MRKDFSNDKRVNSSPSSSSSSFKCFHRDETKKSFSLRRFNEEKSFLDLVDQYCREELKSKNSSILIVDHRTKTKQKANLERNQIDHEEFINSFSEGQEKVTNEENFPFSSQKKRN